MSSNVKGNSISLTRGDSLKVQINMQYKTGEEYIPVDGDKIRFALKHNTIKKDKSGYTDDEPLIIKEIPIDTMMLVINPEDTKSLDFGKYVYDIEITFADGTVDTFITASPFVITEEVH